MHFELNNLEIQGENDQLYIIDPLQERQLLTNLSVKNKRMAYKFNYTYRTNLGNHNLDEYDSEFIYDLPFSSAKTFKINQGYNGNRSHQNQNALDFNMPEGTEIKAVREGIVVKVTDTNSINCSEEDCKKYNNEIIIYHPDGTFAEYTHIKKGGSIVNIGSNVKKGDIIGYSGNVGWSTGPHLHLVIFLQKLENRKTLKTKFKTGDGECSEYLEEKCIYNRNY
ncbi:M23 family metallopeptidase [Flavobacterium sp. ARAG 55.4]|uniref:M23 family metallopeptidase n=1 Tax=Flavobacterium sp. ARAG 55.4 TaxID=3451357 RepID=UPI003F468C19